MFSLSLIVLLFYSTANQYPLDNILDLIVKKSCKINIKLPQDEELPRISGCAFLKNDELLLVDHQNYSLKLLDRDLVFKNSFVLSPDLPWDVSVVDNNTVVITLPKQKRLQFIQIFPSFSRGSCVKFDKKCYGIALLAGNIYVTCHDNSWKKKGEDWTPGEVCILDLQGNEIRKIEGSNDDRLRFIKPNYVAVNRDGSTIFVSDKHTDTITALTATGDILFQYTSPCLGDLWSIKQMYIDSQSNILVCGLGTDNVQIITSAGHKYKTMLISSDGLR